MNTEFFKVYGAKERDDSLLRLSDDHYVLFYGFGKDKDNDESGYCWRKDYDHKPILDEIKADVEKLINNVVDDRILTGFVWNNKQVYLSSENQFNYKAAYDLAVQTNGATLPIKFKLGENDGTTVYHTFNTLNSFTDFYTKAISFINATLNEGWTEKDEVDYSNFKV